MNKDYVNDIAELRLLVGFLGERGQFGWWNSTFLGREGRAFLSPVFSKNHLLAQSRGVTSAAGLVHDQRIGLGDVFHLFRLPEDIEAQLQLAYRSDSILAMAETSLESQQTARNELSSWVGNTEASGAGPTLVANRQALRDSTTWNKIAALYVHGFDNSIEVYPYIGGE